MKTKTIGLETRGQRIFAGVLITSFVGVCVGYVGILIDQPVLHWIGIALAAPLIIVMIPPVILAFVSFVACPPLMLLRKIRAKDQNNVCVSRKPEDAEQSPAGDRLKAPPEE